MIVDIAKVGSDGRPAGRKVVPPQLVADLDHRRDRMAHVEKSRAQTIDALDFFSGPHYRENIILNDFKLLGDLVDDREVIVTDKVENCIQDGAFAQAQQLRRALATLPYFGIA